MKRNYLFKNISLICLSAGVLMATLLSSCKDNSPGSIDFSKSPALIGWQYAGFQATPYVAVMLPQGTFTETTEVALSVSSVTLGSAVSATVKDVTGSYLATYNSENGLTGSDSLVALPSSYYKVSAGSVTIPAGQQLVKLPVTFSAGTITFPTTYTYAIALQLTNATGAEIPSNLNVAIIELQVKSLYEGNFDASGYVLRLVGGVPDMTLGGYFTGYTQYLSTITANSVTWAPLWATGAEAGGVAGTELTVNPSTHAVTVSCTSNATLGNAPGYNNRYDPTTKTFYISYVWSSGTRAETDTLTMQ